LDPDPDWHRLDHGSDEADTLLNPVYLQAAASFRGGEFLTGGWEGDMLTTLEWKCFAQQKFQAKTNTIHKAGHWCPLCMAQSWDFDQQAKVNPPFRLGLECGS